MAQDKQHNQELFEFMLSRLGGERAVLIQYYGFRLTEMAAEKLTLAEIFAEAERDGWLDFLRSMKLTDLMAIMIPSPDKKTTKGKSAPVRYSYEENRRADAAIQNYIEANPWCSVPDIHTATGIEKTRLSRRLRILRDKRAVQSKGKRGAVRYAAPRVKDKPQKKRNASKPKAKKLSTKEAAKYLGMGYSTLQAYVARDAGPKREKRGNAFVYDRVDLDLWLREKPEWGDVAPPRKSRRKKK